MKEVIKVIKENLSFKELPKNLKEAIIEANEEYDLYGDIKHFIDNH